jgi:CHASE2 domain-containing sensor protein
MMWQRLRQFVKQHYPVAIIAPTMAFGVIVGQQLGIFSVPEWRVRDEFTQFRSRTARAEADAIAKKIVIITIDEPDIQSVKKWPIPDSALADLLDRIRAQQPLVIGLDMYRDLPEGEGYDKLANIFKTTPNLIGVEKISGSAVPPAPILKEKGQVGFADLVLDGDRHVRRALLTAAEEKANGEMKAGLSVHVAMKYLEPQQITLEPVDANAETYRLGKTIYQPLKRHDAGYSNGEIGGYQVLLNWYGDETQFTTVSMRDVMAGRVPVDLMRDRMVFIGSIAPSTNDFFASPYSASWFTSKRPTPGVVVHANIAHQLVMGALHGGGYIRSFGLTETIGWIVLWSSIGTVGSWSLATTKRRAHLPGGRILWLSLGTGDYRHFLWGFFSGIYVASRYDVDCV